MLILTLAITAAVGSGSHLSLNGGQSVRTVTVFKNSTTTETLRESVSSLVISNHTSVISVSKTTTLTRVITNSTEISILESLMSSLDQNISSMQSSEIYYLTEASSLNSSLAAQSSINSGLQSALNLQNSTEEASNVKIRQGPLQTSLIVSFQANYAGYVVINGTSSTSNGYIQFTDSYPGYPSFSNLTFGSSFTSILIPVLPGTISIYFGNTNIINPATANISTYYFS